MIEPDIIPPSEFLPRTIETPEKRLLLAVLEEAVGTLQRHVRTSDRHGRAALADVEAWFASDDVALCSFVGICDALGLDAAHVREGLGRWLSTHRAAGLDTVPAVYRFPFRRVSGRRHRTISVRRKLSRRA